MISMAYIKLALNHGALPGAGVTPCRPRELFSPRISDAASGV
jgi:hypothetical protein